MGTTDEGGVGGAENFVGDSLFYALQHTKIWSNSERSINKNVTRVKILLSYIYEQFHYFSALFVGACLGMTPNFGML